MPPLRNGRASKACLACRKQKTRCYESTSPTGSCLRCETLEQACSLEQPENAPRRGSNTAPASDYTDRSLSIDARFERLERIVNSLVERLDSNASQLRTPSPTNVPHRQSRSPESPQASASAPVIAIRDVAQEVGIQPQSERIANAKSLMQDADVIVKGILSYDDASALLALFSEHYGRWVDFDEYSSVDSLMGQVRRSPLLLCACCIIAVRHTSQDYATRLAPMLFDEAKHLLSVSMLTAPQPMEFFQAALVLSLWSTTIGQVPLSVDGWLLSGFALQHSQASIVFGQGSSGSARKDQHLKLTVWNHLCLAHLQYCVGTRRKAMLAVEDIKRCRSIAEICRPNNFELRMVAEINLYWIIYDTTSTSTVDLPGAQARLHSWKKEWAFLFEQPRSQFLQMGFYFAQLVLYDLSLKSRSTTVRESLLTEMSKVSVSIIQLAMDTKDDRTRHLTDHIYHMITFAAVTLCRLLHMYERQVAKSSNIQELDNLIIGLVRWLHSIGLPCHIAHTLGDVVSAFHRKLRPEVHFAGTPETGLNQPTPEDFSFLFPELLGIDSFGNSMEDLLPDWEPFIADYAR